MAMIRCPKGHFYNDQENASCPWCGDFSAVGGPASAIGESFSPVAGKIGDARDSFADKDDDAQTPAPRPIDRNNQPFPEPQEAYQRTIAPQPLTGEQSPIDQLGWKESMAENQPYTMNEGSAVSEQWERNNAPEDDDKVSMESGSFEAEAPKEPDEGPTIAIIKRRMGIDPVVGWLVCVEGIEKGRDYRLHSEKNWIGRSANMDITVKDPSVSRENHAAIIYDPRKVAFKIRPGEVRGIVYLNGEEVAGSLDLAPYDRIELGESKFIFIPFVGGNFNWAEKPDGEER
jgi:hypothetical protein